MTNNSSNNTNNSITDTIAETGQVVVEQVAQVTEEIVNNTTETANFIGYLAQATIAETQKILERTTEQTGQTLQAISDNPILKSIDKIFGLDWLMTLLGEVDIAKTQAVVNKLKTKYPQESTDEIVHRLIVQKAWQAGRLGLITNIIPPVAALLLGVELIATAKLQAEMVYEIAAAHGLDLNEPARRGEVLAIFGLSLGGDILKTGLSIVEIMPGIGAVVGASSNAALLYVLGRTASRFYQGKYQPSTQTEQSEDDWQTAVTQSRIVDHILIHMVNASYPDSNWLEILPSLQKISPSSAKVIAMNLENPEPLDILLNKLSADFAPIVLSRCYAIAQLDGVIIPAEQAIIDAIAVKFAIDIESLQNSTES